MAARSNSTGTAARRKGRKTASASAGASGDKGPARPVPALPASQLDPLIAGLAAHGVERRYRTHALLIQEGDAGDTVYVVKSGRLRVFVADHRGREITLTYCEAGDYVGEMVLDGGPRSASVEAVEPTVCAVVTRETLTTYVRNEPEFALALVRRLIRRARLATQSARSLALIDVYGRLADLFHSMAVNQPDGTRIVRDRLTHRDIASRIACSREMVSRLLKDLETGGYVLSRERQYVLLRPLPSRW